MKTWKKVAAALVSGSLVLGSGMAVWAAETESKATEMESKAAETESKAAETESEETKAQETKEAEIQAVLIELSDDSILVDGAAVSEDEEADVYIAHDILYYEDRDAYESGNPYGEGKNSEKHSAEEAAAHTVLHINAAGTYRLTGKLSAGQVAVDLGKKAKTDPEAVVTLILDNADITCTVAPAVIFYNVYECDEAWVAYDSAEEGEEVSYTASPEVDTSAAGARVILADGSVNNVTGSHVARIYKDAEGQKKLAKYDGAFYSRMTMEMDGGKEGDGVLNIRGDKEGLDSELHLTINGGKINIATDDDAINTNEDGVSVTTINGGSLHILAGLAEEGDGIDSNGYLVINGGVVISIAKPIADSGLDSDMGSMINGGYVVATGSTMDWPESNCEQVTMNLQFAASQAADEALIVTDQDGKVIFAYDPDKDETTGSANRGYQGAVISCPEFEMGATYHVYVGGDVTGEEVDGLYDASTVTAIEGAVRQQYTGTDVGRFGFGGRGMGGPGMSGERPEGEKPFGAGMRGERPEGEEPFSAGMRGERPEGEEPFGAGMNEERPEGETPEGFMGQPGGEMLEGVMGQPGGEMPEGFMGQPGGEMPEGFMGQPGGQMPEGFDPEGSGENWNFREQELNELSEPSIEFKMQDKVNAFSGLADEETAETEETKEAEGIAAKNTTTEETTAEETTAEETEKK